MTILAFDRQSVRRIDAHGRLHIETTPISKATVNPYRGAEIPRWQELGLDPQRIYQMFRDPDEMAKGASSFNNIQLLDVHEPINANDTKKQIVVGCTGSDAKMVDGYLMASLAVWDARSIAKIDAKQQRELSCAYRYDPDMTPGVFEGLSYDGVMRNIIGNHVALVDRGRAGPDVLVRDSLMEASPVALKTRTALMLHGAIAALVQPKLAADRSINISTSLDEISAENIEASAPALAAAVAAAATPHLAADQALTTDDVIAAINGARAVVLASDEADLLPVAAAALPKPAPIIAPPVCVTGITQAAMDAALAANSTTIVERMNAARQAERDVLPYVGEIKVAMDSAAAIYKFAFDALKVDVTGVDPSAFAALLRAQPLPNAVAPAPKLANDAAAIKSFRERYPTASVLSNGGY